MLFSGMYRTIDKLMEDFNQYWYDLVALTSRDSTLPTFPEASHENVMSKVKQYYYEIHACYEQFIKKSESASTSSANVTMNQSAFLHPTRAHLPKLNLPKFSGQNIAEWPLFRDSFESLVHKDDSLTPIEKYHFLVGLLSGPALAQLKSIEFVQDNYSQAWELLMKCYNNKRQLASNYIDQILNFKPSSSKSTRSSLNHFLSVVGENVASLTNLKITNGLEYILFELAVRGLDRVTREAFEFKYSTTEFPKVDTLRTTTFHIFIIFFHHKICFISI